MKELGKLLFFCCFFAAQSYAMLKGETFFLAITLTYHIFLVLFPLVSALWYNIAHPVWWKNKQSHQVRSILLYKQTSKLLFRNPPC